MIRKLLLTLCGLLLLSSSCENALFDELKADDPFVNFDYLWNEVNEKYSFFEFKGVDWEEARRVFRAQVRPDMTQVELFDLLFAMLLTLRDGHVNLISPFDVSRFDFKFLAPENYNSRLVEENYLGLSRRIIGPFEIQFLREGEIGYIRYSSFSGTIQNSDISLVLSAFRDTQGIIFDVRNNGGGSPFNIFQITDRITDREVMVYRSTQKSGPGPNDFGQPTEVFTSPREDAVNYDGRVAVLTNRRSFSATSFFAVAMKELDDVIVLGDTTGGGAGAPNGGQLPNGWTYRFSVTQTETPDGFIFEDGVPPDIQVDLDSADVAQGLDTIIERAIEELM